MQMTTPLIMTHLHKSPSPISTCNQSGGVFGTRQGTQFCAQSGPKVKTEAALREALPEAAANSERFILFLRDG